MDRSPSFGSAPTNSTRYSHSLSLRLRHWLNLAGEKQLAGSLCKRHAVAPKGSDSLWTHGFRFYFTPLNGVLFTFPSRYWFTIGRRLVFSLGGWSPRIQPEFHVFRPTWDSRGAVGAFGYGAFTLYRAAFQRLPLARSVPLRGSRNPGAQAPRFRLFPVRSPLLGESLLMSFPPGTEMFHFPGCSFARPMCSGGDAHQ